MDEVPPKGHPLNMSLFTIGTLHIIQLMKYMGITVIVYTNNIVMMDKDKDKFENTSTVLSLETSKSGSIINMNKTHKYTRNNSKYTSLHQSS